MTWSYDPNSVGSDPVMQVRLLIQDTAPLPGTAAGIVQNEEIQFFIDTEANIYMAAARSMEAAATNILQLQSRSTTAVHVSYLQPAQIHQRANYLRQRGMSHQNIRANVFRRDKLVLVLNEDWAPPMFSVADMDNQRAGQVNPLHDPTQPILPGA